MKFFRNIFLLTLSFMIAISSLFSNFISAEGIDQEQEVDSEEVEELAAQLEFIYEEASIKDDNGNIIDFDFESIEAKYGTSNELHQLKQEMAEPATDLSNTINIEDSSKTAITARALPTAPNKDKINKCIYGKIKGAFNETLTITTLSTLYNLAKAKKYKTLAKKLLSVGIKGNAPAIAIQIMYYEYLCVKKYNG
ncbi:hypothetical protein [Peribacillus butanolivorans]|uniref:hypothetical protein n=1 Tax=Peribacillus butanolivorans TaxID=421767 RepID=UPI00167F9D48|nr:hypothetical protein [Peribacillus butanolivorans]QNU03370.1 hypothetical protein GM240_05045 [Peribacillus butanolivorans]